MYTKSQNQTFQNSSSKSMEMTVKVWPQELGIVIFAEKYNGKFDQQTQNGQPKINFDWSNALIFETPSETIFWP